MRVECTDIAQFCQELQTECKAEGTKIHRGIVRMREDRDEPNPDTGDYGMGYWLTALIETADGMYCLELGKNLGQVEAGHIHTTGYRDPIELCSAARNMVQRICTEHDLTIRTGKWEII